MNPADWIRADVAERALLNAAIIRAAHYRRELDGDLARLIISEYADLMKRSNRRR